MSLRGNIRKVAVIVAVTGAAALAAPAPAMAHWHASDMSSGQSLDSGSAGVGLFGPHASWFNFREHSEDACIGDCS
ncbi:hypothetical protein PUR71_39005 [Streptomyces sp. SP17BM10]|uniref:hypothetical protein n=1 Tax=Streptomyces sp. SP17BM10 TaxID=3002530 RepID=UPI002E79C482|nr:hypothetical protein [Streptomyces sp. SP17BM10]MEE1788849.1 hypothetical protein [Streptomyces sp. SP17BM10]